MINNEYDTLKTMIVGREYNLHFNDSIYHHSTEDTNQEFEAFYERPDFNHSTYSEDRVQMINGRNEDLDNLAKVLENNGVKVFRSNISSKHKLINGYELGSNIRDIMFTIKDYVIITKSPLTMRSFEYTAYMDFVDEYINELTFIQIPLFDMSLLKKDRKSYDIKDDVHELFRDNYKEYFPIFDAANLIKHDGELIMNICNHNEYAGFKYLERLLPIKIHPVFIDHHHIDGAINIISDKVVLVCYDSNIITKESFINKMPNILKGMDFIHIDKNPRGHDTPRNRVIASVGGMFINIISINANTVITNVDSFFINEELEERGFNVIKVRFKDSRLFGGGIHCTTLDIERE